MNEFIKKYKLWLTVVLAVVLVGGIWMATKDNGSGGSKTSSTFNKEVQTKCMADVNEELFCKFAGSFAGVGDYKVTVNSTAEGSASVLELASDSKGNSSMVVKVNGQEQGNVVVFSGVTYSKDYTDGQWFKYAASDTSKPEALDLKKEFVKGDFKADNGQKIDYVKAGTEKCGSLNCYKYQIKDPTKPTEEGFLWFDTKDYLMRRVTIKDSNNNADMTLSYSAVSISAPSPTKDVPSDSSLDQ
ncbi:MAG: hypothetical protein Q7R60_03405 [bacterium]|nr:hypothetical protein [bacterium]